jgi:hypothetical protein
MTTAPPQVLRLAEAFDWTKHWTNKNKIDNDDLVATMLARWEQCDRRESDSCCLLEKEDITITSQEVGVAQKLFPNNYISVLQCKFGPGREDESTSFLCVEARPVSVFDPLKRWFWNI